MDTTTHKVVKSLPCEPGRHGANFSMKSGGGYYAYVASKFANDLIVIDMDTLEIAGKVLLATPEDSQIVGNNGMGGQGVLPLRIADHGWIEETAKLVGSGKLTAEVEGWLKAFARRTRKLG